MERLRPATADDARFLEAMLAEAADWRPGTPVRPVAEVMADPALAHYVAGWPADGDFGVVAEIDGRAVGACWCRRFDPADPGYGFVAPDVPELSIGVVAAERGRGVGRLLLAAIQVDARRRGIERLSLSVEIDNDARRLYASAGFVEVEEADGAVTMVHDVGVEPVDRKQQDD